MNSSRPYLVRALYEWIVDNDCTPHMLVNSEFPAVQASSITAPQFPPRGAQSPALVSRDDR